MSLVLFEKTASGLTWVTLNRPEALNAINIQMRDDLWDILHAIRDDPEIRCVIFRGNGEKAFSAGADIAEFGSSPSYTEARRARRERDLWQFMLTLEKPLIAAIHGYALGAGIELSMCCDLRIASEDASIGLPEVGLGYIPSAGGTQTLPRHLPPGVAIHMILTGDPIDAQTAFRYGLVQRLAPYARLYEEAAALAHKITARPPELVAYAKRAVFEGADLSLSNAIALESSLAERSLLA